LVEAFLVAGSKSVVASLWSAEDTSVSALMERFYQRLGQGENTNSALRNAKLDVLAKYGDQLRPFYWAAYITVGKTRCLLLDLSYVDSLSHESKAPGLFLAGNPSSDLVRR
jgi:hypothetical protein